MKFRSTVATASLSFSVLTNIVFAQNTANNEILIYPPKKPPITKKWYKPLEFGEGRFTTGLYSGLNRFPRRRVNADMLDPFGHRPLPTIKKKSSSFKPGTWNWRPGKKPPAFSYRYRIINLTKDLQGSYEGMPGDYRQNYRPIPHVRFGGTFAPIPPLMGDPTQHRQGWYIKKYRDTLPKRDQYNQYIMDNVNDKIEESYPSLEWVTYSWNNPYNQKYNLSKDKIRPRFGSYEAFSNYDSRFPAYKPKRRYEVIKIPEAPPIYKRSAEKEDPSGKNAKSIDLKSVPSKSEDVIRNLQSASSIMQSALRTARLRQEPESVISSSDYDSNEVLNSENSISLSSVYESSGTNSSSSDSLIDSEAIRKAAPAGPGDNGKKSLLFSAHRKQKQQQNIDVSNMRHVRHKRSPPHKGSVEKLAKKLNLSPKKEESKWTFKNMPSEAPELPNMSIFRLEDQPDSFWDSIYGRTNEKNSSSSSDSDSSSDSELEDATMNPVITTMQMQRVPKVHPGIGLPQDKKKPFLHLKGGINQEPLMETRGKRDRARREKKKKKLTSEEREEKKEKKKRKGRTNFARDYPIEIPREGADLKGMDAFRFPTFPPEFTSFVPPRPYKQPTPYVQPTIPPRPPPRRPYVRIAEVQQSKINNAQHTENNMFHLQNNMYGSPHEAADSDKVRIINGNVERVQSDIVHVQNKAWNKHITGSRVDNTKQKVNVIKDNVDRIQSDMHNIKNSVHNNGKKKEFFASIPHLHGNKGLHGSLGLPDARRRNLERTLRFGDDRLYDSEEISENDKAVIQQRHGLIGEHHNQIAHDLKAIAGGAKAMKSSPNIGKHIQIPHAKPDVLKTKWVMKRQKRFAYNDGDDEDDYEGRDERRHSPRLPPRFHHNDWESLELKPAPEGWPQPTLPVGGYRVHPDNMKQQYTYKPFVRRFGGRPKLYNRPQLRGSRYRFGPAMKYGEPSFHKPTIPFEQLRYEGDFSERWTFTRPVYYRKARPPPSWIVQAGARISEWDADVLNESYSVVQPKLTPIQSIVTPHMIDPNALKPSESTTSRHVTAYRLDLARIVWPPYFKEVSCIPTFRSRPPMTSYTQRVDPDISVPDMWGKASDKDKKVGDFILPSWGRRKIILEETSEETTPSYLNAEWQKLYAEVTDSNLESKFSDSETDYSSLVTETVNIQTPLQKMKHLSTHTPPLPTVQVTTTHTRKVTSNTKQTTPRPTTRRSYDNNDDHDDEDKRITTEEETEGTTKTTVKVTSKKTTTSQIPMTAQTTHVSTTKPKILITRMATISKHTTVHYLRNVHTRTTSLYRKHSFRTSIHTTGRPRTTAKSSILSSGVGYISKMFSFVKTKIFKKDKS